MALGCMILGCLVTIAPRVTFAVLWIIGWFQGSTLTVLPMIIGFVSLPITTLYIAYTTKGGGNWSADNVVFLLFAVVLDIGSMYAGKEGKKKHEN